MVLNEGLASPEASLDGNSRDTDIHASIAIDYDGILSDLCIKIEGASYYSGSSSTLFLRGTLAKFEEERRTNLFSSSKNAFSPRGLTDALLEKLLLEEVSSDILEKWREKKDEEGNGNDQEADKEYENYLTVGKALACDSSKYLPAIAASLSHMISLKEKSPTSMSSGITGSSATTISSSRTKGKRSGFSITREFLQLWIDTLVDDSTPENLYDQLCRDLFRSFQQQNKLRNSNDPLALPTGALSYLVEGDSWHCTGKSRSLSPPSTQATLRRASVLLRFLSRGETCAALDSDCKQRLALTSGAMGWFLEVLKGEGYPTRYQKQRRETWFGLLDLLLQEFKMADNPPSKNSTSVEWLFSPNFSETVFLFFKETILELVEDWKRHLQAVPLSQHSTFTTKAPPGTPQTRTNRDLVSSENRKALECATRYIKFVARLSPSVCPCSSLAIVKEASNGCDQSGKDLLTAMLRFQESPLQRLRLVRLIIDEFSNNGISLSTPVEKDSIHINSRKEWLSSPGILNPILQECSRDPFLASSDTADRFLNVYGGPSWKSGFFKKPMPREAPKAIPIETFQANDLGGTRTMAMVSPPSKTLSPIPSWLSDSVGRFQSSNLPGSKGEGGEKFLLMLRNKVGDRLFGNNSRQADQYSLFGGRDRVTRKGALHTVKPTSKQPQDQYNLFDG